MKLMENGWYSEIPNKLFLQSGTMFQQNSILETLPMPTFFLITQNMAQFQITGTSSGNQFDQPGYF
jgi:hypothetical protein